MAWFWLGVMITFIGLVSGRPLAGFLGTLGGTLCLFIAFGLAITKSAFGIVRGSNNLYSLSRLQMAGWTWLILSALIAVAVARLWHQADKSADALNIYIPSNLFIVMGISFFTGAAAPALLSLKSNSNATQGQLNTARVRMDETGVSNNGQVIVRDPNVPAHFGDLVEGEEVSNAGTVDISKVQQLLITLLLMGVYFAMLWNLFVSPDDGQLWQLHATDAAKLKEMGLDKVCSPASCKWAALPDFPASLVTLLAVSHGGYLAYKAAPRSAPGGSGSSSSSTDVSNAVG